jgi:hypothetical protein
MACLLWEKIVNTKNAQAMLGGNGWLQYPLAELGTRIHGHSGKISEFLFMRDLMIDYGKIYRHEWHRS